jgi:predicted nucleic acid-binding protein
MGQGHLLDSNVIIDFLSGVLPADGMRFVSDIVNAVSQVSAISKIELLRFTHTPANERVLEDFIKESVVLPIDDNVINETIRLCKGNKTKIPDAIIAATCIVHRLVLVTRNVKDFRHINGLQVSNPWEL